jgi:hypothetical protein
MSALPKLTFNRSERSGEVTASPQAVPFWRPKEAGRHLVDAYSPVSARFRDAFRLLLDERSTPSGDI